VIKIVYKKKKKKLASPRETKNKESPGENHLQNAMGRKGAEEGEGGLPYRKVLDGATSDVGGGG